MTDEQFDLPGDGLDDALRRELSPLRLGFDEQRADEMIRLATDVQPLGARSWQAPLAAAAAVVVVGGGAALIATHQSGHDTAAGGGPVACPPSSAAPTSSVAVATPTRPAPLPSYEDYLSGAPTDERDRGWYAFVPCAPSATPAATVPPSETPSTSPASAGPTPTQPEATSSPPSASTSSRYAPPPVAAPTSSTAPTPNSSPASGLQNGTQVIRLAATAGHPTTIDVSHRGRTYDVQAMSVDGRGPGAFTLRVRRAGSGVLFVIAKVSGTAGQGIPTLIPRPSRFGPGSPLELALSCTGSAACSVDVSVDGRYAG